MKKNESQRLARYIMTNGKVIQDRIIHRHVLHISQGEHKSMYRELSMAQLHTVMSVHNHGEITMTELSALTMVSPPSASSMVDRLVEKGILVRERCARDRRKVMVKISPKAVKGIERIESAILHSFANLMGKIGYETAHKWCEVLDKVRDAIGEEENLP